MPLREAINVVQMTQVSSMLACELHMPRIF
jgi:hypothetical protein